MKKLAAIAVLLLLPALASATPDATAIILRKNQELALRNKAALLTIQNKGFRPTYDQMYGRPGDRALRGTVKPVARQARARLRTR